MVLFHRFLICGLFTVVALSGCSTIQIQPTGRSATDQMLSAMSIEDAVRAMNTGEKLRDKTVKLEVFTPGIDEEYLENVLKAWVVQHGGVLVKPADATAEITLRVLAQSTGSDKEQTTWSIPIALPSLQTGLVVSRIDFYRSDIQVGRCRLWAYALDPQGRLLFTQMPVYAVHHVANPVLFGVSLGKRSDLQELRRTHDGFSLVK